MDNRRVAARSDRLGYFVVLYYSLGGPLSTDGNLNFILIKSSWYYFSLKGFSKGFYPEKYVCKCVYASADLFI
jgi:hypothetical protein